LLILIVNDPEVGFGKTSYLRPFISSIPVQSLKVTLTESEAEQFAEFEILNLTHVDPNPPVRDVSIVISGVVNPPGDQK